MIIGILSDTHDQVERTRHAVELLTAGGAECYIHCGDITEEHVLDLFAGLPTAVVFGNNDIDRARLTRYGRHLDINMLGTLGILDLGGKRLAVTHGDRAGLMKSAVETPGVDYVLHGHTHVLRDERRGGRPNYQSRCAAPRGTENGGHAGYNHRSPRNPSRRSSGCGIVTILLH